MNLRTYEPSDLWADNRLKWSSVGLHLHVLLNMTIYSYDSSVSQMLKDLDLSSLENRRKMNKLTLLYKIRNNRLCIK